MAEERVGCIYEMFNAILPEEAIFSFDKYIHSNNNF